MVEHILYHHRTRGRKVEGVHIRSIAGQLRHLGCRVAILSPPGVDPEAPEANPGSSPAGVSGPARMLSFFADRAPEFVFELAELAYNLVTFWRVRKYIRREKPRWIYERYSLFLFSTVWLGRRYGIPVVLEVSDSAVRPRVRSLVLRRLARRIEKWVFNHCDGLVFVSDAFRQQVLAVHGSIARSIVSPNAADTTRFDPSRYSREAEKAALGLSGRRVCGYLGAFIEWHGIHHFVERIAPRLMADDAPGLLLVGDGNTRARSEESLACSGALGRAVFAGNVPHDEVPRYLAAMDYSVLPDSNTYGSPVKLFELMAMGVPVVAPDYGPVREVIKDGRTGWLFPAGDIDACIERVLSLDQEEVRRVGENAREYIVSCRQWRHNAGQLLALFRDIETNNGVMA